MTDLLQRGARRGCAIDNETVFNVLSTPSGSPVLDHPFLVVLITRLNDRLMAKATDDDTPRPRRSLAAGNLARIGAGFALLALLYYWQIIDFGALRVLTARPDILALALAG